MGMPSPEIADTIGRLLRTDPARTLALAQSLRAPERFFESTVAGMSMGPALGPGARIRIGLIDRDRYEPGEVVAYLAGSQVVVHRVAHRGRAAAARGYLITRGDAALVPDPRWIMSGFSDRSSASGAPADGCRRVARRLGPWARSWRAACLWQWPWGPCT